MVNAAALMLFLSLRGLALPSAEAVYGLDGQVQAQMTLVWGGRVAQMALQDRPAAGTVAAFGQEAAERWRAGGDAQAMAVANAVTIPVAESMAPLALLPGPGGVVARGWLGRVLPAASPYGGVSAGYTFPLGTVAWRGIGVRLVTRTARTVPVIDVRGGEGGGGAGQGGGGGGSGRRFGRIQVK